MGNMIKKKKILFVLIAYQFAMCWSCTNPNKIKYTEDFVQSDLIGVSNDVEIAVEAPPFTDGIFPCNDCI